MIMLSQYFCIKTTEDSTIYMLYSDHINVVRVMIVFMCRFMLWLV